MSSRSAVLAAETAEGMIAEVVTVGTTVVAETAVSVVMTAEAETVVSAGMTVLAAAKALAPTHLLRRPMTTKRVSKRCSSLFTDIGEAD